MKYIVDEALCAGHGLCEAEAPDVYVLDDEGFNARAGEPVDIPDGLAESARRGAAACPESAIQVVE